MLFEPVTGVDLAVVAWASNKLARLDRQPRNSVCWSDPAGIACDAVHAPHTIPGRSAQPAHRGVPRRCDRADRPLFFLEQVVHDMGKHRGSQAAPGLLAWILHLRAGRCWIVRCRDECGHRVRLRVWVSGSAVLLSVSGQDAVLLPGLAVGRLREALRAAVIDAGLAAMDHPAQPSDPPSTAAHPLRQVSLRTPPSSLGVPA